MSMVTLASQLVRRTKAELYAAGLSIVQSLGVTTTSWAPGDPTRSLYHFIAELMEAVEANVAGYVASGFLGYATGDWLTLLAYELYGVERIEATYATAGVLLENLSGAVYGIEIGDLTIRHDTTGKTYRSTTSGTLAASDGVTPTTLELIFTADEAGSDSNAIAGDIGTLTTTLLGVTLAFSTAAVGLDEEDDESLRDRCRAKLGMLSPNGPADAYSYVVRDSSLTGVTDITRARVLGESTTGDVTIYVAGAAGPVATDSVTAAQDAVEEWATPLCMTPTVNNVTGVPVNVTYSIWLYASVGVETPDIETEINAALTEMFARRPIGGDIIAPATTGKLYQSLILSTIREAYPDHTFRVTMSAPSGDTTLTISDVATLGTVTGSVTLEVDP